MKPNQTKWIFLALLALIWGSSFILICKGLVGLSPFQLGALRLFFAGLFILAIGWRRLPEIPQAKWKLVALSGLLGSFLPAFLFALAETRVNSTIGSMLNSLTPLNALVMGFLLFRIRYGRPQVLGVVVGLAGSALLIFGGAATGGSGEHTFWYAMMAVLATIFYGINVNLVKKYLSDLNSLTLTAGTFAVMTVPALVILYFTGLFDIVQQPKAFESTLFILILGVMGTGVANILFYRLIQLSSTVFATSVTYLIPIVAFGWGLLENESLTLVQGLGALVVLAGVYLSSRK